MRAGSTPNREAVVDGDMRFTYGRVLRALRPLVDGFAIDGCQDTAIASPTSLRTRTRISKPTMPYRRSAAVLVPINYRLFAEDFEYIINHSGAKVVCVHS